MGSKFDESGKVQADAGIDQPKEAKSGGEVVLRYGRVLKGFSGVVDGWTPGGLVLEEGRMSVVQKDREDTWTLLLIASLL